MKEKHNRRQVSLKERYNIKLVNYDFNKEMFTRTESFNQMVREPIFIEYLNDQLEYSKQVYLSHLQESQEIDGFLLYQDRKSTRLNSSHVAISYAVFCLKKKKKYNTMN